MNFRVILDSPSWTKYIDKKQYVKRRCYPLHYNKINIDLKRNIIAFVTVDCLRRSFLVSKSMFFSSVCVICICVSLEPVERKEEMQKDKSSTFWNTQLFYEIT